VSIGLWLTLQAPLNVVDLRQGAAFWPGKSFGAVVGAEVYSQEEASIDWMKWLSFWIVVSKNSLDKLWYLSSFKHLPFFQGFCNIPTSWQETLRKSEWKANPVAGSGCTSECCQTWNIHGRSPDNLSPFVTCTKRDVQYNQNHRDG